MSSPVWEKALVRKYGKSSEYTRILIKRDKETFRLEDTPDNLSEMDLKRAYDELDTPRKQWLAQRTAEVLIGTL